MKNYTILVSVALSVELEAASEDEAIDGAIQTAMEQIPQFYVDDYVAEVVKVTDEDEE